MHARNFYVYVIYINEKKEVEKMERTEMNAFHEFMIHLIFFQIAVHSNIKKKTEKKMRIKTKKQKDMIKQPRLRDHLEFLFQYHLISKSKA